MTRPIRIANASAAKHLNGDEARLGENRQDTFVVDEPFYAYYLNATGKQTSGGGRKIATGEINWREKIVAQLTGPIPKGRRIFFQKQMTHHLLPEVDRRWLDEVTNCFLIRDPRGSDRLLYQETGESKAVEHSGYVQEAELFDFGAPVHAEIATRPFSMPKMCWKIQSECCGCFAKQSVSNLLSRCCLGCRDCARPMELVKHWYGEVAKTTSFQPYRDSYDEVPNQLGEIYERCRECYERLERVATALKRRHPEPRDLRGGRYNDRRFTCVPFAMHHPACDAEIAAAPLPDAQVPRCARMSN